jgi:hypothetical protein
MARTTVPSPWVRVGGFEQGVVLGSGWREGLGVYCSPWLSWLPTLDRMGRRTWLWS